MRPPVTRIGSVDYVPLDWYHRLEESMGGDRIGMVRDFMRKFGLDYDGGPRELPASVASLRKKLLLEECDELVVAIDRGELHEQLDAVCDLLYVVYGTAIAMGFRLRLEDAFVRVHQSNMAKVKPTRRQESKRDNAGDIVKPEGWKPPDLRDLVRSEK